MSMRNWIASTESTTTSCKVVYRWVSGWVAPMYRAPCYCHSVTKETEEEETRATEEVVTTEVGNRSEHTMKVKTTFPCAVACVCASLLLRGLGVCPPAPCTKLVRLLHPYHYCTGLHGCAALVVCHPLLLHMFFRMPPLVG